MSFLSPGFAWLFLCLPVIVILYLLRPRHNDHPVPSTLLWQRALAQEQAQRPLQKLRRHLLLPLQLLTSAVLILCLMHPVMNSGKSTDMIFVFDLSASMQTREDGGSRLDLARAHALQLLDRMDPGSEVTVITQSLSTLCPLSRSTDRVLARRILDGLRAQDGPADLDAALSLARSLKAETEAEICVFTDKDTLSDPDLHLECLGTPQNNTAMTAFDVRDGLAFVALRAYGAGGVRTVRLTEVTVPARIRGLEALVEGTLVQMNMPRAPLSRLMLTGAAFGDPEILTAWYRKNLRLLPAMFSVQQQMQAFSDGSEPDMRTIAQLHRITEKRSRDIALSLAGRELILFIRNAEILTPAPMGPGRLTQARLSRLGIPELPAILDFAFDTEALRAGAVVPFDEEEERKQAGLQVVNPEADADFRRPEDEP